MSDSEVQSIGHYLKIEREKKKISIKIISQHTRINTTMLEYLENDDKKNLPDLAYARGYVKSYAKALNLDLDHCLNLFDLTYSVKTNRVQPKQETTPINFNYIIPGIGLVLAVLTIFFLVRTPQNQPTKSVTVVELNTEQTSQESKPIPVVKEETPVVQQPTPTPTAIPVVEEVKKPESPKVEEIVKTEIPEIKEEIKLRPISGQLYSFDKSISQADLDIFLPASAKESIVQGKQNIFINAVDGSTWITYKADDEAPKKFVLQQGRTIIIRGDTIRLFLGNVNATKVFLNNELLNLESKSGVKSLIFPGNKSADYKLPLFIYPDDGTVITSDEYEKSLI